MSPMFVALIAAVLVGVLHVVVPRLVLQARRRQLHAACRQQRAIAITFDDGPGHLLTSLVVQRLAAAGVPATFFVLGERVKGREATVRELVRAGHQVGSHGNTHVHHIWSWPWDGVFDSREGWRALRDAISAEPHELPFRPPYGKLNLLSLLLVLWKRAPIAMWTHDSGDSWDSDQLPAADLAAAIRSNGGGVVLMHDFDRSIAADNQRVLAKLDAVLQLQREGFTFVRATDLLAPAAKPSTAAV